MESCSFSVWGDCDNLIWAIVSLGLLKENNYVTIIKNKLDPYQGTHWCENVYGEEFLPNHNSTDCQSCQATTDSKNFRNTSCRSHCLSIFLKNNNINLININVVCNIKIVLKRFSMFTFCFRRKGSNAFSWKSFESQLLLSWIPTITHHKHKTTKPV